MIGLFVLVILCGDGGAAGAVPSPRLPPLLAPQQLPSWGASEAGVSAKFPALEGANDESDVGRGSSGWRHLKLDGLFMGVAVSRLGLFFDNDRLSRVALDFATQLDSSEDAARASLNHQFETTLGKPFETGRCWSAWKADFGVVVVEPGRVQFFAPESVLGGVDRACLRLTPLRVPTKARENSQSSRNQDAR